MGTWGVLAFDNDSPRDWAFGLDDVDDLSLVEGAVDAVTEAEEDYLDSDLATDALAACEVIARLRGAPGYQNPYTEPVDAWVKVHPLKPPSALIKRARTAIDRILGAESELNELWAENDEDYPTWRNAVEDLRDRMGR